MARYANDADDLLVMSTHRKRKSRVLKESRIGVLVNIHGLVSSDDESDESDVDSISSISNVDVDQISDESDEWSNEEEMIC